MEKSANEYAKELLERRRVSSVWEKIQNVPQGGQLLLASASLEPIVKSLADAIGARYVASTLETRNGVLTGRYLEDLTGNKELAITKKYGSNLLSGFSRFLVII